MSAEITRYGALDMQVCVPKEFTDEQVVDFANQANMSGTSGGWGIVKAGSKYLAGDPERQPCKSREGHVHIMLQC